MPPNPHECPDCDPHAPKHDAIKKSIKPRELTLDQTNHISHHHLNTRKCGTHLTTNNETRQVLDESTDTDRPTYTTHNHPQPTDDTTPHSNFPNSPCNEVSQNINPLRPSRAKLFGQMQCFPVGSIRSNFSRIMSAPPIWSLSYSAHPFVPTISGTRQQKNEIHS